MEVVLCFKRMKKTKHQELPINIGIANNTLIGETLEIFALKSRSSFQGSPGQYYEKNAMDLKIIK